MSVLSFVVTRTQNRKNNPKTRIKKVMLQKKKKNVNSNVNVRLINEFS